ncbi:MAG TPA: hypothetical protein VLJ41_00065, partial [Segetibacter sp.]|nr:hypothetical protein [Segetibacter sp.]
MIRFFKSTPILILCFLSNIVAAQVEKSVQFSFLPEHKGNQTFVTIKAKIPEKVQLFSIQKKSPEDAFVSSVEFDSASKHYLKDSLIEIGKIKNAFNASANAEVRFFTDSVEWKQEVQIPAGDSIKIKGTVNWLAASADTFPTGEEAFSVKLKSADLKNSPPVSQPESSSLWSTFLLCLVTGLFAVLTPCVFPLVPVTVSFFLKRSKSRAEGLRNATWYSLSIILIYTIPTLIITLLFGGNALYNISTHPVTNLLFFTIFILFAISFFGAFDISLPNSWANKADEKA